MIFRNCLWLLALLLLLFHRKNKTIFGMFSFTFAHDTSHQWLFSSIVCSTFFFELLPECVSHLIVVLLLFSCENFFFDDFILETLSAFAWFGGRKWNDETIDAIWKCVDLWIDELVAFFRCCCCCCCLLLCCILLPVDKLFPLDDFHRLFKSVWIRFFLNLSI